MGTHSEIKPTRHALLDFAFLRFYLRNSFCVPVFLKTFVRAPKIKRGPTWRTKRWVWVRSDKRHERHRCHDSWKNRRSKSRDKIPLKLVFRLGQTSEGEDPAILGLAGGVRWWFVVWRRINSPWWWWLSPYLFFILTMRKWWWWWWCLFVSL